MSMTNSVQRMDHPHYHHYLQMMAHLHRSLVMKLQLCSDFIFGSEGVARNNEPALTFKHCKREFWKLILGSGVKYKTGSHQWKYSRWI